MARPTTSKDQHKTLHKVPSTPNARAKWLLPPLSPGRSVSLSPSRANSQSYFSNAARTASTSPLRQRKQLSASPGPTMAAEKRRKLNQYNTLDDAVRLLKESTDIGILCGAGISTAVGIPDFRSKDGLYNKVSSRFNDPQELFYRETFEEDPKAFWKDVFPIVPKLKQGEILRRDGSESKQAVAAIPKYSKVHSFFDLLQGKDKLNTIFTQNIDALELAADVDPDKIIACHGSWDTATCLSCDGKIQANDYLPVVLDSKLPLCECGRPIAVDPNARQSARTKKAPEVDDSDHVRYLKTEGGHEITSKQRVGRKKRRAIEAELGDILRRDSDDDDKFDPPARRGLLKPNITFFGETIVSQYAPRLAAVKHDLDLLIIIGTSLAAAPVNQLPLEIPADVPQIWISNKTLTSSGVRGLRVDIELVGDADSIITELCARAGWSNALVNRLWRNQLGSRKQAKAKMLEQALAAAQSAKVEDAHSGGSAAGQISDDAESLSRGITSELEQPAIVNSIAQLDGVAALPIEATSVLKDTLTEASVKLDNEPSSQTIPEPVKSATKEQSDMGSIQPMLPASVAIAAPTVSPSKSPPLPFRSGSKRPLSIGDALTPPASSIKPGIVDGNAVKASSLATPEASPARPAKVARTQSTASVAGKSLAGPADPGMKIFTDDIFDHITYFKKK